MSSAIVEVKPAAEATDAATLQHVDSKITPFVTTPTKTAAENVNSLHRLPSAVRVQAHATPKRGALVPRPIAQKTRPTPMARIAETD